MPFIDTKEESAADWWGSFDWSQWSRVPENSIMTGITTSPCNSLYCLEEARYRSVKSTAEVTCESANWWGSLDATGWSNCQAGQYMAGLFRNGNAYDSKTALYQLEEGWCCKPKELPTEYGQCVEVGLVHGGISRCPTIEGLESAMVGLYRNTDSESAGIEALTKMKCCTFKNAGLV